MPTSPIRPGVDRLARCFPGWGLLTALALSISACGSPSPEQRLRHVIDLGHQAAEQKEFGKLGEFVSESYTDGAGRDRRELLALVRGYLFRQGLVYIVKREKSLGITAPGRGEVTLVVAVASVPIESLVDLNAASADILRVDLEFAEEGGDWKLIHADWTPAEPNDLF